ncbi:hypothetical protein V474_23760 [Novosphingobium barchaimii LL02]|uniref:Uncharacterized protein n=1 Tax=Novosphingobium barchaimii LL02 TaxID=1114963 RepID=A0A0J7XMR6_9SPHN|nr:hypothetical protein V474_23760 [Novosphingobium barchaimii LL02]
MDDQEFKRRYGPWASIAVNLAACSATTGGKNDASYAILESRP